VSGTSEKKQAAVSPPTSSRRSRAKPADRSRHLQKAQEVQAHTDRKSTGKLFEDLVALQARLRAPGGCPWDREQTHDSLRPYLVEETYEVLDALDSGDAKQLAGELGDLLLQVIFHAQLAAEAGQFDMADVIEQVHTKMVRRHPHVFGKGRARTAAQVLKNWEELKAEERRAAAKPAGRGSSEEGSGSVLDAVPRSLPAVLEAHQLTRRAANLGFDWSEIGGLFEKLMEEAAELRVMLALKQRARIEEEMGDLLFVGVNLARFLGLDAEIALKRANRKFAGRFREMERTAAARGLRPASLSPEEWDSLWREAKARGGSTHGGRTTRRKKSGSEGGRR
jgi:nucleoside triphosphate diphosphatase